MGNSNTKVLLDELREKHSDVKNMVLILLDKFDSKNSKEETLRNELFKIYLEMK